MFANSENQQAALVDLGRKWRRSELTVRCQRELVSVGRLLRGRRQCCRCGDPGPTTSQTVGCRHDRTPADVDYLQCRTPRPCPPSRRRCDPRCWSAAEVPRPWRQCRPRRGRSRTAARRRRCSPVVERRPDSCCYRWTATWRRYGGHGSGRRGSTGPTPIGGGWPRLVEARCRAAWRTDYSRLLCRMHGHRYTSRVLDTSRLVSSRCWTSVGPIPVLHQSAVTDHCN